ncbi:hypothetical protein OF83DRAFT_1133573 [Amylostereum chailletii]|nr:hypothetical protein OF83DRAFT_1133573 [Amylostereum chailletii]
MKVQFRPSPPVTVPGPISPNNCPRGGVIQQRRRGSIWLDLRISSGTRARFKVEIERDHD